jgi:hypothetical protein
MVMVVVVAWRYSSSYVSCKPLQSRQGVRCPQLDVVPLRNN